MKISASSDEIDLRGNREELEQFSHAIGQLVGSTDSEEFTIDATTDFDPRPYDQAISKVKVRKREGKMTIGVENGVLEFCGSLESLLVFKSCLPFDAATPTSGIAYHVHFDWVSFPSDVSEGAVPVTLTLDEKGEAEPGAALNRMG